MQVASVVNGIEFDIPEGNPVLDKAASLLKETTVSQFLKPKVQDETTKQTDEKGNEANDEKVSTKKTVKKNVKTELE